MTAHAREPRGSSARSVGLRLGCSRACARELYPPRALARAERSAPRACAQRAITADALTRADRADPVSRTARRISRPLVPGEAASSPTARSTGLRAAWPWRPLRRVPTRALSRTAQPSCTARSRVLCSVAFRRLARADSVTCPPARACGATPALRACARRAGSRPFRTRPAPPLGGGPSPLAFSRRTCALTPERARAGPPAWPSEHRSTWEAACLCEVQDPSAVAPRAEARSAATWTESQLLTRPLARTSSLPARLRGRSDPREVACSSEVPCLLDGVVRGASSRPRACARRRLADLFAGPLRTLSRAVLSQRPALARAPLRPDLRAAPHA